MSDQLRIVIKQFSARKYNRGGRELFQRGERLLVLQREGACVIFVRESDRTRTNPYMALSGSFDAKAALANMFRLSWKWRERPTVKITERTLEKRTEVLHRGREGRHPEAAFAGTTAGLEAM